jgi:TonB family protein
MQHLICVLIGSAFLTSAPALAQETTTADGAMLPCEGPCAIVTRPGVRKGGGRLYFPPILADANSQAEGIIEMRFVVKADGRVEDVVVERLMGPPEFASTAKRIVQGWTYEPATVDGKPADLVHCLRIIFNSLNDRRLRKAVQSAYEQGFELIKQEKFSEARIVLSETLNGSGLNFYERGLIAYLLSLNALQSKDFPEARRHSALALKFPASSLPDSIRASLYRVNILSSLQAGDIAGTVHMLAQFGKAPGFDAADPLVAQVNDVHKRVDAARSFISRAVIPPSGEGEGYGLNLYRRNFSFRNVVGKLENYTLGCREFSIKGPVTEGFQGKAPDNASDCSLFVTGAPGTTFSIIQAVN